MSRKTVATARQIVRVQLFPDADGPVAFVTSTDLGFYEVRFVGGFHADGDAVKEYPSLVAALHDLGSVAESLVGEMDAVR